MKPIPKFLSVAIAVISITACSKKDDTNPSKLIIGKWNIVSDTTKSYTNGILTDTYIESIEDGDYAQFNSDGSGISVEGGATSKFNYTISGNTLTLKTPAQTVDSTSLPAITEADVIKVLTSTQLYIYHDDTDDEGSNTYRTTDAAHFSR